MGEQKQDRLLSKHELASEHLARLQAVGAIPMTAEEILSGQTQAGVPRPAFLADHEDDGTVHSVVPLPR